MKKKLVSVLMLSVLSYSNILFAKTNSEIATECTELSESIIELAKFQTKEVCVNRLINGANWVSATKSSILLDRKDEARTNINWAIENIGMATVSGCNELTPLHFVKAKAYQIRNAIDGYDD